MSDLLNINNCMLSGPFEFDTFDLNISANCTSGDSIVVTIDDLDVRDLISIINRQALDVRREIVKAINLNE